RSERAFQYPSLHGGFWTVAVAGEGSALVRTAGGAVDVGFFAVLGQARGPGHVRGGIGGFTAGLLWAVRCLAGRRLVGTAISNAPPAFRHAAGPCDRRACLAVA